MKIGVGTVFSPSDGKVQVGLHTENCFVQVSPTVAELTASQGIQTAMELLKPLAEGHPVPLKLGNDIHDLSYEDLGRYLPLLMRTAIYAQVENLLVQFAREEMEMSDEEASGHLQRFLDFCARSNETQTFWNL